MSALCSLSWRPVVQEREKPRPRNRNHNYIRNLSRCSLGQRGGDSTTIRPSRRPIRRRRLPPGDHPEPPLPRRNRPRRRPPQRPPRARHRHPLCPARVAVCRRPQKSSWPRGGPALRRGGAPPPEWVQHKLVKFLVPPGPCYTRFIVTSPRLETATNTSPRTVVWTSRCSTQEPVLPPLRTRTCFPRTTRPSRPSVLIPHSAPPPSRIDRGSSRPPKQTSTTHPKHSCQHNPTSPRTT